MELRIRNNGILATKLIGKVAPQALEMMKPHMVEVPKNPDSECACVFRMTEDMVMPMDDGRGSEHNTYLWADRTTISFFV